MSNIVYILGAGCSRASKNRYVDIPNPVDQDFWGAVQALSSNSDKVRMGDYLHKFLNIFYPGLLDGTQDNAKKVGMEEVFTYVDSFLSLLRLGGYQLPHDHLDEKDDLRRSIALLGPLSSSALMTEVRAYCQQEDLENSPTSYQFYRFFLTIEDQLIELIHDVLMAINYWSKVEKQEWECDVHRIFAARLKREHKANHNVSVITFNYDLLLERALGSLEKDFLQNNLSYYLWQHKFDGLSELLPDETENYLLKLEYISPKVLENDRNRRIEILKLHGSLNWFAAFQPNDIHFEDPEHVFYISTEAGNQYFYREGIRSFFPKLFSKNIAVDFLPSLASRTVARLYQGPVRVKRGIVAPILEKMNKFKGTYLFESLWRRALEVISLADEIWIAGYSLPPADYLSRWLLRTGIRLNRKMNPCKNVHVKLNEELATKEREGMAERYKSIFGPGIDVQFDGFESLK